MKILVTADTHGYYNQISDYILLHDDIDLLIHAGDGVDDVVDIHNETGIDYYVVDGNNDFFTNHEFDEIIEIDKFKIFLTHGHNYYVDFSYDDLVKKAKENNCNIIIHGHTHKYVNQYIDDILILNPGSIFLSRDRNPGFVIMTINDDKLEIERISV